MHYGQQCAKRPNQTLQSLQALLVAQQPVFHLGQPARLSKAHISNFLKGKRSLSLEGLDRVLAAQELTIDQLLPLELAAAAVAHPVESEPVEVVPVVSPSTAMEDACIPAFAVIENLHVSASRLVENRARPSPRTVHWKRYVAIRSDVQQAAAMEPLLAAGTISVIDRHYNSLAPYRAQQPTLYAVRSGATLVLRFLDFDQNRLILRPSSLSCPVQMIALAPNETPANYIVGRVCLLFHEL